MRSLGLRNRRFQNKSWEIQEPLENSKQPQILTSGEEAPEQTWPRLPPLVYPARLQPQGHQEIYQDPSRVRKANSAQVESGSVGLPYTFGDLIITIFLIIYFHRKSYYLFGGGDPDLKVAGIRWEKRRLSELEVGPYGVWQRSCIFLDFINKYKT